MVLLGPPQSATHHRELSTSYLTGAAQKPPVAAEVVAEEAAEAASSTAETWQDSMPLDQPLPALGAMVGPGILYARMQIGAKPGQGDSPWCGGLQLLELP